MKLSFPFLSFEFWLILVVKLKARQDYHEVKRNCTRNESLGGAHTPPWSNILVCLFVSWGFIHHMWKHGERCIKEWVFKDLCIVLQTMSFFIFTENSTRPRKILLANLMPPALILVLGPVYVEVRDPRQVR